MKTLIITAAITLTSLFASAQTGPQLQHKVIKITKIVGAYDTRPTAARIQMQDSMKKAGFTVLDWVRIPNTSNAKITFVKVIR